MAKKRLLFIEDLYDFCVSQNQNINYSVDDEHPTIVVQSHGTVQFNADDTNATDGLTKVKLQACHIGKNRNMSSISQEVMEENLSSILNRPILGYIHEVDGEPCFESHNMHEDENGELVYDEFPVGIVPESANPQLVYDSEKDKTYVEVDGYLFDEYSKASEIMKREQQLDVSVELNVKSYSFDCKEKCLSINSFNFSGITILQKRSDGSKVEPGMQGSNIKLADFSSSNNSLFASQLDSLQEKVDSLLSCFDKLSLQEGGLTEEMDNVENFEETSEVIVTEEVSEDATTEESTDTPVVTEVHAEEESDVTEESSEETYDETTEDTSDVEEESDGEEIEVTETEACGGGAKKKKKCELDPMTRSFEISHDDIRYALYNLLAPYEESDNDWYCISAVYDNHFVYEGLFNSKVYGQSYSKNDDEVSFEGERYELFKELLTASEKAELDMMRSNYAALVEFKETTEKNELHAQKEAILSAEKYSVLSDNESFKALVKDMDNYSLTDLEKEAKVILADHVTVTGVFELESSKKELKSKTYGIAGKKVTKKRYGNLFDEV